MQALRRLRLEDGVLLRGAAIASAFLAASSQVTLDGSSNVEIKVRGQGICKLSRTQCEEIPTAKDDHNAPLLRPSWARRTLALLNVRQLPIPRLLGCGDPLFQMDPRLLKKRQHDEQTMQDLVRGALQERDPKKLQALNDKCLELAYGEGVTMKIRQDFVHRHGCTAWTEDVLDAMVDLGKDRGIVEIGAGNGQWARALMEHYQKLAISDNSAPKPQNKKFDFVLAYDDKSELPLDQQIFNKKTKIHHDYFYDKVRRCDANFSNTLRHWECRGRILLLVYPPPGDMALNAVQQYTSASPKNDTVIYIGEGRDGANANKEFFDHLENGNWAVMNVMDVKPLGSKGYEKLFILKHVEGNVD